MVEIRKKCWHELFNAILSGKKNFDLRLDDFQVKEGDILVLEEFNPKTKKYTGRKIEKRVNFVMKTKDLKFWSKKEIDKYGYIVIGF